MEKEEKAAIEKHKGSINKAKYTLTSIAFYFPPSHLHSWKSNKANFEEVGEWESLTASVGNCLINKMKFHIFMEQRVGCDLEYRGSHFWGIYVLSVNSKTKFIIKT